MRDEELSRLYNGGGSRRYGGPYVQIYTAYHPVDPTVRLTGRELAAPITIGNNVWIGGGVIICPGVTIADNTTIGAGSIVTKDIPAHVVAAGNPCKVIRTLYLYFYPNLTPISQLNYPKSIQTLELL